MPIGIPETPAQIGAPALTSRSSGSASLIFAFRRWFE